MNALISLPNIGKKLAERLDRAGIASAEALKSIGSENACIRIATIDPSNVCINMLYALEGAVQGIRWHGLDASRKEELRLFFGTMQKDLQNSKG